MIAEKQKPLMLSAPEAAKLIGIGKSLFWSLHASGRIPLPVKLGRRTLWRRDELEAWCWAGCPTRDKWQAMQSNEAEILSRRTRNAI